MYPNRKEYIISRDKEDNLIKKLCEDLKIFAPDMNAGNTLLLMVSPDYSATVAMHVAHKLSYDGEMVDMLPIQVPYPDQHSAMFIGRAVNDIMQQLSICRCHYKYFLLVEAAVIRGSNYQWLTALINDTVETKIVTASLLENTRSVFKSDVVAEYYDNELQDVTFYYEQFNKHWA